MALAVGMGIIALKRRRLPKLFLVIGAVLLIGAVIVLQGQNRLRGLTEFSSIGVQDRWFMWQSAWHMIQSRPWLGQGLNTFMANYLTYWVGGEQQPRYAHNCFLQTAAETGILGLLTFLLFLGAMAWLWWRSRSAGSDAQRSMPLHVALAAALVGFLVQSAFDTNLYALRHATLFWTLAGLTTGLSVHALRRPGDAQRPV